MGAPIFRKITVQTIANNSQISIFKKVGINLRIHACVKEVLVKCKNCKKKKQLLTRGVCSKCYRRMNYAIQTGKVTAEQLEDAGLWLEKRGRGPIEDFAAKVAK